MGRADRAIAVFDHPVLEGLSLVEAHAADGPARLCRGHAERPGASKPDADDLAAFEPALGAAAVACGGIPALADEATVLIIARG